MITSSYLFPEGRPKALTMSYDDGVGADRRLVDIFNRYGIKGTFHLNSGLFGQGSHISAEEAKKLYQGHEISCHSQYHPFLERGPRSSVLNQMREDRKKLEQLTGCPVRGMSYPFGTYNQEVEQVLTSLDIVYSRTVVSTGKFGVPENWLEWHPTCHHREDILEKAEAFKKMHYPFSLFYVWGHSFEFDRNDNWDLIEQFCQSMAGQDNIWYATNIEIYDYVTALRRLEFSVEGELVRNPSAMPVWLQVNGEAVKVKPGELRRLG